MKNIILFPANSSGRREFVIRSIFVCVGLLLFSNLSFAGFRGFDEGDQWYLSVGAGYHYIDEKYNAVQLGEDQVMNLDNDIYPVFRLGWAYTDHIILEGGFRYDIYSGELKGMYVEDGSDSFTGFCLMVGPTYRFDTYEMDFLGEFRPFVNCAIGYRFPDMSLDFPVEGFDSSFGWEISAGITKGPFELRLGYSDYRYSKDGTIADYQSDGSNNRLNQTGIFIELSYLISFEEKKKVARPEIKVPEVVEEPEEIKEEVKSSEEITEIFKTVDEATNVSKELYLKIEFDFDSDVIKPVSFPSLNELGMALLNFDSKENTLLINGHADSDGPSKYNLGLSERRAASVKRYIMQNFELKLLEIITKGYGEFQPLLPNTSEYNKGKNRRVEVMMKYHDNPVPEEGVETP